MVCVPTWTWREHVKAAERVGASLFAVRDLPVTKA